MPFGIGSSKKPKDKGNVTGKYLLYTTAYHWSSFSIIKINVKNCSMLPGGAFEQPHPLPTFFNFIAAKCVNDLGYSPRLNGRVRERPVLFRGDRWICILSFLLFLSTQIIQIQQKEALQNTNEIKKNDNEKDLILIQNWLAFYLEPNIRVLFILSLVIVFIFVCLSSMSLCFVCLYVSVLSCLYISVLSCLYVFVWEWLVAGKFTWVKHPSSWSICGHRSYLRFFPTPPPSYTDLITPATDLLS